MTLVTFGRAAPTGRPVVEKAFNESASGHGAALGERSRLVGTASDILLFVGLVSVLLLLVVLPPDPTSLRSLFFPPPQYWSQSDLIMIPVVLSEIARFSDPPLRSISMSEINQVAFDYAGVAFGAAGLLAAIRRRWRFVIAAALFLIFPWSLFGFVMKMAPGWLCLLALVSAVRLINPRAKWRSAGVVAAAIIFPSPALFLIDQMSTPTPRIQERYLTIRFDELKNAEARLDGGKTIAGVIGTLAALEPATDAERAALAFALAQEFVLRGKLPETAGALRAAKGQYPDKGASDEKMISAVEKHLSALGGLGTTAKTNVMNEYHRQLFMWRVFFITGQLLILLAIGIDILAFIFRRRSRRLDRLGERLVTAPGIHSFRTEPGPLSSVSFSLLDADTIMEKLSGRMRIYRFALMVFGVAAAIALCTRYAFTIPDASSNTAFDNVALVSSEIATYINRISEGAVSPRTSLGDYYFVGGTMLLGVGMLLFRMTRVYVLPAVAVMLTFSIISDLAVHPVHTPTAARELFTQAVRVELAKAIDAPPRSAEMDSKSVRKMRFNVNETSDTLTIEMDDESGNQAGNKTIVIPGFSSMGPVPVATLLGHASIEPNSAAFALLQLAYLDNDALMAAKHLRTLDKMTPPNFLDKKTPPNFSFVRQRIEFVREWVSTQGQTVEAGYPIQYSTRPMTDIRWTAKIAGFALAGILMLAAIPLGMLLFAWNRKRQIEQLSDRHRQEFSLLAS